MKKKFVTELEEHRQKQQKFNEATFLYWRYWRHLTKFNWKDEFKWMKLSRVGRLRFFYNQISSTRLDFWDYHECITLVWTMNTLIIAKAQLIVGICYKFQVIQQERFNILKFQFLVSQVELAIISGLAEVDTRVWSNFSIYIYQMQREHVI